MQRIFAFLRLVLLLELNRFGGKNLLDLRRSYAIWKKCDDFVNLFGVTELVASDQIEPTVDAEHAEKRVRETIRREISGFCFVKERESSFANRAKIADLSVFLTKKLFIDWEWRAKAANTIFRDK